MGGAGSASLVGRGHRLRTAASRVIARHGAGRRAEQPSRRRRPHGWRAPGVGPVHNLDGPALDGRGRCARSGVRPRAVAAGHRFDSRHGIHRQQDSVVARPRAGSVSRPRLYLQPRDYVYLRLTGAAATDYTLASRTVLLDLSRRDWWEEGCAFVGVSGSLFPSIYPSAAAPFGTGREAADALGITYGTPVALGGGHRPCEVLGSGASSGWVTAATGTTTNVSAALTGRPAAIDHRVICSLHVVDGMSVVEQRMFASGAILRWMRDRLLAGLDYPTIDALAASVPPGAGTCSFSHSWAAPVPRAGILRRAA